MYVYNTRGLIISHFTHTNIGILFCRHEFNNITLALKKKYVHKICGNGIVTGSSRLLYNNNINVCAYAL